MREVPAHRGPQPESSAVVPSLDRKNGHGRDDQPPESPPETMEETPPEPVPDTRVWLDLRGMEWREQLEMLGRLQDGYAGEGSRAPEPVIVRLVRGQLSLTCYPVESVLPDGRGGVLVTHRNGNRFAVFREGGGLWIQFASRVGEPRSYRL